MTSDVLLELSEIPHFDHPIISPRQQQRIAPVPGYHVDIALVGVTCQHVGLVRSSPAIPDADGLVHRTGGKNLKIHTHTHTNINHLTV